LILFGFLSQSSKTKAVAAMPSAAHARTEGADDTSTGRADALFELTDGAPRGAGVPDGGERPPIFPSS
jgi:hypothetical protein